MKTKMRRLGSLLRRMIAPSAQRKAAESPRVQVELRDATENEIDEAIDESFPASDPPALHLEKDR